MFATQFLKLGTLAFGITVSTYAFAAESGPGSPTAPEEERDIRREVPITAYTYSAYGVSAKTVGVQAYGLVLAAPGQDGVFGGGGTVWGSPMERLTLIADGQRNLSTNFSPSAAAVYHLLGERGHGVSLGALGKFKIDGFAAGPHHDEVESELEFGALFSVLELGWALDANAIIGRGLGDDGETDAEGRLRLGKEIGELLRVGLDGQARARLSGPRNLPNGRSWDFAAGAQVFVGHKNLFGSLTGGPSTMGLTSSNVGFTVVAGVGGTTF